MIVLPKSAITYVYMYVLCVHAQLVRALPRKLMVMG